MSVQFGRWNFDGKPVAQDYLEKVQPLLLPYGSDDRGAYSSGATTMLYCAFHTTEESRRETQPHVMASGAIITWDGRLDNRAELIRQLGDTVTSSSTDVSIVAAAYDRWGNSCFAQFMGDWTLAIWEPRTRSLTLAKDPIGVRHLYYSFDDNQVTWSTILDPLVLFAAKTLAVCEEYIAGWFSSFPAAHLTPYVGINAVPPSSFVVFRPGKHSITKYWDFDPNKRVRYRTDPEYEEHFRAVFSKAVRRRLRSDTPILAELSGGMDSSSIVCMAKQLITRGEAETPGINTISYYDDSEANWNERPYFIKVEEKLGCTGIHVDLNARRNASVEPDQNRFAVTPAAQGHPSEVLIASMKSQANRVVLSGIGGDEIMGGVPTPIPELGDLLARVQLSWLAHRLKIWALNKRKPWFHLLFETVRTFLPTGLFGMPNYTRPAPWLNSAFVKRNREALRGYEKRITFFGPLPSFQECLGTLEVLRRQLSCEVINAELPYEKRYPYLDRELLQFIYSIPREQLVRPGQRRSLMRRALVGVVPNEVLDRKRKAYAVRAPMAAASMQSRLLDGSSKQIISCDLGIVERTALLEMLQKARSGQDVPLVPLLRTIGMDQWLQKLQGFKPLRLVFTE